MNDVNPLLLISTSKIKNEKISIALCWHTGHFWVLPFVWESLFLPTPLPGKSISGKMGYSYWEMLLTLPGEFIPGRALYLTILPWALSCSFTSSFLPIPAMSLSSPHLQGFQPFHSGAQVNSHTYTSPPVLGSLLSWHADHSLLLKACVLWLQWPGPLSPLTLPSVFFLHCPLQPNMSGGLRCVRHKALPPNIVPE